MLGIFTAGRQVNRDGLQGVGFFERFGPRHQLIDVVGVEQRGDHRAEGLECDVIGVQRFGGVQKGCAEGHGRGQGDAK